MNSKSAKATYYIARRVGQQGARTPVGSQAGIDKYATGSSNLVPTIPNHLNLDCNVVIVPFDVNKFKDTCRININNLHLVHPESSNRPFSRPLCPVKVNNSPESSNLHIPPIQLPKTPSHVKQCHVCKITIKGKRGLTLHLNSILIVNVIVQHRYHLLMTYPFLVK